MEEDNKKHIQEKQCPRKLNCPFAVKILQENLNTPVPFSWERNPGCKDEETDKTSHQPDLMPPSSSRWEPPAMEEAAGAEIHIADQLCDCVGESFHGSDAIDIFSLAESMENFDENCKTCTTEEPDDSYPSPDFIIQRFLPDARALAAASVAQKKLMFSSPLSSNASFSRSVGVRNAYPSVKGCGFRSIYHSLVKPKGRIRPRANRSCTTWYSPNK